MKNILLNIVFKAVNKAGESFKVIRDAIKQVTNETQKANSQTEKYSGICKSLDIAKFAALLEITDKAAQSLSDVTSAGMTFNQKMADLSSITGITGEELKQLEENARKFGAESGLGAETAARAYTVLASQIQVSEMGMDGLNKLQEKSITLAEASGMTLDDAATALAGTINQFGMAAEESDRVINVLAAGSKFGAAEISELSQSFKVVGSAASAMGLNVESTAGALEVLSKANLKGSEAGTALRNIIVKMNTELGVDLGEIPLSKALESLKPRLSDVTYLSKVFGIENIAAAQFLIQNAEAVDTMTAAVTNTNVAQEQAAICTNTAAHKVEVFRAQITDAKIGLASIMGPFGAYTAILVENATAAMSLMKGIKMTCSCFANVTKAIKSAVAASKMLKVTLGGLAIAGVIIAVAAAYKSLSSASAEATRAMERANAANAAGNEVAIRTRMEIDQTLAAINATIAAKGDESKMVQDLNAKYGDSMGCYETLSQWYDALSKQADKYIDKLFKQAKAQELISQAVELDKQAAEMDSKVKNRDVDTWTIIKSGLTATSSQDLANQVIEDEISSMKAEAAKLREEREAVLKEARKLQLETVTASPISGKMGNNENTTVTTKMELDAGSAASMEKRISEIKEKIRQTSNLNLAMSLTVQLESAEKELKEWCDRIKNEQRIVITPVTGVASKTEKVDNVSELKPIKMSGFAPDNNINAQWNTYCGRLQDAQMNMAGVTGMMDAMSGSFNALSGAVNEAAGAWLSWGANLLSAIAAAIPAIMAVTNAQAAEAASGAAASQAAIPIVGPVLAVAAVASVMAALLQIPKFANGGIAYGPTLGLFGEYSGASSNPEVVAPLSRLRDLIEPANNNSTYMGGKVEFKIEGRTLVGVLNKMKKVTSKTS